MEVTRTYQIFAFALLPLFVAACGGKSIVSADEGSGGGGGGQGIAPLRPTPPSELPATSATDTNDVWIVFDAWASKESGIYAMRTDGSQRTKLDLGTDAANPAFAANGKALAYARHDGIWIRDLTTNTSTQLTHGTGDSVPAFSPLGTSVAFGRGTDLYVINVDGTDERAYIKGPPPGEPAYGNYGHPVFTKDGASLVFDHRGAMQMGALDGSGVHDILTGSGAPMPALSPDGATLAFFLGCSPGNDALYTVAFADAARACDVGKQLVRGGIEWSRPSWGANGVIAYRNYLYEIAVIPAAGGDAKVIFDTRKSLGGAYLAELAFSPPGTSLESAFVR